MSKAPRRPRRYNRIVLKLSGECLASPEQLYGTLDQVVRVSRLGTAVAVVVGAGNIIRGRDERQMDRVLADQSGMLATVINGNRLLAALSHQVPVRHLSALRIPGFVEYYSVGLARTSLAEGAVLVLSGGTGNPFFSTDSAAALRAAELEAQTLLKGTNVAGVYSADPRQDPNAQLYPRLSYEQALKERLAVMDSTAFAFCRDHRIPIHVFDLNRPKAIIDIIQGKQIGSCIC